MGLSTEQTTAVIDSVAKVVEATNQQPEPTQPDFLIPLFVTIAGGIATTIFGVWYTKKRKKK
jgi:hypothetical protein